MQWITVQCMENQADCGDVKGVIALLNLVCFRVYCLGITAVKMCVIVCQDSRDTLLKSTWHSNWPSRQVANNLNDAVWW